MNNKTKRGFTLVELLVVIAIIGILATLAVVALQQARKNARDAKRIADIKQIQTALELYYNEWGIYPDSLDFGGELSSGTIYMSQIPKAPTPADGSCASSENSYSYTATSSNRSYELSFCLGSQVANINSGKKVATPAGILSLGSGSGGSGTPSQSLSCLNPNPGFEILVNISDKWNLDAVRVSDFSPNILKEPTIVSDAQDGSFAVKFNGDNDHVSFINSNGVALSNGSSYFARFYGKCC